MKYLYLPFALAIATAPMFHVAMAAADYAKGVIIINENNYGEAGTLNHLQPDLRTGYFTYRIFQKEIRDVCSARQVASAHTTTCFM